MKENYKTLRTYYAPDTCLGACFQPYDSTLNYFYFWILHCITMLIYIFIVLIYIILLLLWFLFCTVGAQSSLFLDYCNTR